MTDAVMCPHCHGHGEVDEGAYYEPEVLPCSLCLGEGAIPADAVIERDILGLPVLRVNRRTDA